MKTIVLGGYGNFGARISGALAHSPGIELVIAGRDLHKARTLAAQCGASAAAIDVNATNLADVLRKLGAGLVIHTAGPFQDQNYGVPLAVAEARAHYIDLADGRRFVCDFSDAVNQAFLGCERIAITGASTVPALSSAVVDHLAAGWRSVGAIEFCIAPAQTAARGVATMAAVLSYCGAPVKVWQDGRWVTRHGWAAPVRVEYARLRPRLAALCDIPDLELFPFHYPDVQTVTFRAALELGISQRGMALLAALRRIGVIKRPERLAGILNRASNTLDRFGSALGGMVVRVRGIDGFGEPVQRSWHIAADGDHGPEIPCMAAILLARRIAAGSLCTSGACTSTSMLALEDFAPEFNKWNMVTDLGA